jgi:hypothetical protein
MYHLHILSLIIQPFASKNGKCHAIVVEEYLFFSESDVNCSNVGRNSDLVGSNSFDFSIRIRPVRPGLKVIKSGQKHQPTIRSITYLPLPKAIFPETLLAALLAPNMV